MGTTKQKQATTASDMRHEMVAATAAGIACTVIGHPLDTLKVHMQVGAASSSAFATAAAAASGGRRRFSVWRLAAQLLRERALFRGMAPPMANQVVVNACMFGVFRAVRDVCGDSVLGGAMSGLIAGFATATISTPTDYVKIQAQLRPAANSWTILKETIRTQPTRAFRGHVATMARNGLFTGVYLGLYDAVHPQGFWQICLAGSVTGALAWIASFPADTIKSVIQRTALTERISMRQAARQVYQREHSWRSFYWGCAPSTGRAAMVTSLRMIAYETAMGLLRE